MEEQEDSTVTAQNPNQHPPLSQECKLNPAKYTCPGCSVRSCSLPCVKAHKQHTACTGKRQQTQFVPLSQFDDNLLKSGTFFFSILFFLVKSLYPFGHSEDWISDEYEVLYQVRVLLVILLLLVFVVMVDAFKALVCWFLGLFAELLFMGLIVISIRSEFQVED